VSWISATSGSWSDGSKWSSNPLPPQPGDDVEIAVAGTYTVTLDVDPNLKTLLLGGSSGKQTLVVSGRTITTTSGATVAANGELSLRSGGSLAGALTNSGRVIAHGSPNTISSYTSVQSSLLRIDSAVIPGIAALTISNGFTNHGAIELIASQFVQDATLTVSSGALTNASDGTITSLPGVGGTRGLVAEVVNQAGGKINVAHALTMNRGFSAHTNAGSITLSGQLGDLTLIQSGGSFSNLAGGTITIPAGRLMLINHGSFHPGPGTISGAGTLAIRNCSAFGITLGAASPVFELRSGCTVDSIFNGGTVIAYGNLNTVTRYTSVHPSLLRLNTGVVFGNAQLTITNGFVNHGAIELTSSDAREVRLTVSNGSLTNATDGTITSLLGLFGSRVLEAELWNEGALDVQYLLDINKPGAAHRNGGSIMVTADDLTVTQSSGGSFSNQVNGTIAIPGGRLMLITGGGFSQDPGSTSGGGTLAIRNCSASAVTLTPTSAAFDMRGGCTVENVVNGGTMIAHGNPNTVTGGYASEPGSLLVIDNAVIIGNAALTIPSGFTNHGAIEFRSSYCQEARLVVSPGVLVNADDGAITSVQGACGALVLQGAVDNLGVVTVNRPLEFQAGPVVNRPAGTVRGGSTLNVSGVAYADSGSTRPGTSPGILTIQQNDTRESTSALYIEIRGPQVGTQFDRLVVTGTATLGGALRLSTVSFTPEVGDSFAVLTTVPNGRIGTFGVVSGGTITPGVLEWQVKYKTDRVDLIASAPSNNAPNAVDDTTTTGEDQFVDVPVLANDIDADGNTLHVVDGSFAGPQNGSVALNPDESVRYTPMPGYVGSDSFTYVISDDRGGLDTATVHVLVTPLNASAPAEGRVELVLHRITPSPTHGAARMIYWLPRETSVRLSLCDVIGREVQVLESGSRAPGRHEVQWNGRVGNRQAASGVYFVRLEAAGERRIARVVVTR
jgi:hypothetical protein